MPLRRSRALPAMTAAMLLCALPAQAQQPLYVVRSVTLPVELKEPFKAYAIGLIPFGSCAAASYVGTTRLSWDPPAEFKLAAWAEALGDLALLGAGAYLASRYAAGGTDASPMFYGGITSLAAIPVLHVGFYAPAWGQAAVRFNRERLEKEGFSAQDGK